MSKILAEKLRALREYRWLTQREISAALFVDRSTYAYYELAKTEPPIQTLLSLSRFYRIPLEPLCDDRVPTQDLLIFTRTPSSKNSNSSWKET